MFDYTRLNRFLTEIKCVLQTHHIDVAWFFEITVQNPVFEKWWMFDCRENRQRQKLAQGKKSFHMPCVKKWYKILIHKRYRVQEMSEAGKFLFPPAIFFCLLFLYIVSLFALRCWRFNEYQCRRHFVAAQVETLFRIEWIIYCSRFPLSASVFKERRLHILMTKNTKKKLTIFMGL